MKTRSLAMAFAAMTTISAGQAIAQETLLVPPVLPYDFDKGRNISVVQRARPEFDPIGIDVSSFKLFPSIDMSGGYTSNVYYADVSPKSDGYVQFSPAVRLASDWSRHSLELRADTQIQRYFSETRRNQEPWNVRGIGALEFGDNFRLVPEGQIAQQYETPFSSDTQSDQAALSSYLRKFAGLRGEYSGGQTKLTLAVDDTNYQFSNVTLQSGNFIDQSDRDRNIFRVAGQAQYAFTPSIALYTQASYDHTVYDRTLLSGVANRDSDGYRIIGGFNFDLASLLRGTVAIGYMRRDYIAPIYKDVDGLSFEGQLEYFPTELTTFTLGVRRLIADASIGVVSAYFDNRISLRADHELLYNLLINGTVQYQNQDYIDINDKSNIYQFNVGAVYLSSNWLSLNVNVGYTARERTLDLLGQRFDEFRGQIGLTFKR